MLLSDQPEQSVAEGFDPLSEMGKQCYLHRVGLP